MSEYKVYWLTGFPLIKLLGAYQEIIMVIFLKGNKQVQGKINNFTFNRDRVNKK